MFRDISMLIFISITFLACGHRESDPAQTAPRESLAALENEVRQHFLDSQIEFRLKYGMPVVKLPDISYEHALKEKEFAESILNRLTRVVLEDLNEKEKLSLMALRWQLEMSVEGSQYFWISFPAIPYSRPSLSSIERAFQHHDLKKPHDLDAYKSLLNQYAPLVTAIHHHYTEQVARGILMPKAELDLVVPMLATFKKPVKENGLFVEKDRLVGFSDETVKAFQQAITQMIDNDINPAFEKLITYLDGPYREETPKNVGLSQYPNGKSYYNYLVRYHTTLDLTPEEIHKRGLQAVESLNQKIDQVQADLGFQGSRADFRNYIKTNPAFYPKTSEEIGETLMSYITRLEPVVDQFFSMQPSAPYGVDRLPETLEGSMTFGYYQWPTVSNPKGHYLYNGSNLEARSLLSAASLIYHELVPGHHFQIATQYEIEGISDFRRDSFHTAYTEGWAEYASGLAWEMGGYPTAHDQLGRYLSEMFFAVRLVVDTGMNALGWSREEAMEFMRENLLESDLQIQTESLRYSVPIPGQALAYRIGAEKIRELRARVEEALGDRFDIRHFHRAILENGSLPLTVLEQRIDWFIENELKGQ